MSSSKNHGKGPRAWKRVKQGLPHDYRILKIREDQVADPRDGRVHGRVVIDCVDWVNIIPVTLENDVVLIRQFRTGVWENTLEIPGGMVDEGEEPLAAAVRELEEETGYVPGRVVPLGWTHPNPAIQHNRCFSFLALGCEKTSVQAQDSGEDILVELHPRKDIYRLLREGQITHALVVAAFGLERLYWDHETAYGR